MTTLPPDITTGYVTDWIALGEADGVDADRKPDARYPVDLTITFTPKMGNLTVTGPIPGRVWPQPVVCGIDPEGYLIDSQGTRGVWLVTGQWSVKYEHPKVPSMTFTIEVLPDHTEVSPLYLSVAQPPGGTALSPSEYAELAARLSIVEDAVISGVLDTGWQPLTLENGWAGTGQVRRHGKHVSVRFTDLDGTAATSGNLVVLPNGYVPGSGLPAFGVGNNTSVSGAATIGIGAIGGTSNNIVRVEGGPSSWVGGGGSIDFLTDAPFPT